MKNDYIQGLCTSPESIASEYAKDSSKEIGAVVKHLRKEWKQKASNKAKSDGGNELDVAMACGKFPGKPSDLFLKVRRGPRTYLLLISSKVYADILGTLEEDPFANLISPSLTGSAGTIPLSIVSVIPDIMRHYAQLIVRARSEVFLATNYWENSHSSQMICDALKE